MNRVENSKSSPALPIKIGVVLVEIGCGENYMQSKNGGNNNSGEIYHQIEGYGVIVFLPEGRSLKFHF